MYEACPKPFSPVEGHRTCSVAPLIIFSLFSARIAKEKAQWWGGGRRADWSGRPAAALGGELEVPILDL
jgi:hypothetical protein